MNPQQRALYHLSKFNFLGSESDTDRDEHEKEHLKELSLEIAKNGDSKKKVYLEDFKKAEAKAKF
jgi:hypothetical protein